MAEPWRHHELCGLQSNCDQLDCPAVQARRRRIEAYAGAWSKLSPPDEYNYRTLNEIRLSCNAAIELQAIEERVDDWGSYVAYQPRGVVVRYELDGSKPVLYGTIGGHLFTAAVQDGMRFRWPEGGRP